MEAARKAVVKRISGLHRHLSSDDSKRAHKLEQQMYAQAKGCKQTYNHLITKVTCRIVQLGSASFESLVNQSSSFWDDITLQELMECDPNTIIEKKKKSMEAQLSGHLIRQNTGNPCPKPNCKGTNIGYTTLQTRGADEPETLYWHCPDCEESWQE
uniref:Transcription elongation factor S-II n=1 Tax=Clandestinovirus TaxID=2831644 RepID=A0A8F8PML4_9VIRU|nr:transcription elongation factor S-II [Clandestinovirus]